MTGRSHRKVRISVEKTEFWAKFDPDRVRKVGIISAPVLSILVPEGCFLVQEAPCQTIRSWASRST
jgi:hypothetical protein